jgi:hypothetical protein
MTVNEARKLLSVPPLEGPDGDLTLAAYAAKIRTEERVAVESAKAGLKKDAAAEKRREEALDRLPPPAALDPAGES